MISAHYAYAIGLKASGDSKGALEQLRECERLAEGKWPSRKMEVGVRSLVQSLAG